MHLAWYIPEIRNEILQQTNNHGLVRLAQTCAMFFEACVPFIWGNIDSYHPLLACVTAGKGDEMLEIDRLMYYTSHIKNIGVWVSDRKTPLRLPRSNDQKTEANKRHKIKRALLEKQPRELHKAMEGNGWFSAHSEIEYLWIARWTQILSRLEEAQLDFLPNVKYLRFRQVSSIVAFPILAMSGTSLQYIEIDQGPGPAMKSMERFLHRVKPAEHLKYLHVLNHSPDLLVQESKNLKELHLPNGWVGLSGKDTITHLNLRLNSLSSNTSLDIQPRSLLPNLKSLWLYHGSCTVTQSHESVRDTQWLRFLNGLANPDLETLNIVFPAVADDDMFLSVIEALASSCALGALTRLGFLGRSHDRDREESGRILSRISPKALRTGLSRLLPLKSLKELQIKVAPNFLDSMNPLLAKKFASEMPCLEKLALSQSNAYSSSRDWFIREPKKDILDRTKLSEVAAFCHRFLHLKSVFVAFILCDALEEKPNSGWVCPGIVNFHIGKLIYESVLTKQISQDDLGLLQRNLRVYFPNCQLVDRLNNTPTAPVQTQDSIWSTDLGIGELGI